MAVLVSAWNRREVKRKQKQTPSPQKKNNQTTKKPNPHNSAILSKYYRVTALRILYNILYIYI